MAKHALQTERRRRFNTADVPTFDINVVFCTCIVRTHRRDQIATDNVLVVGSVNSGVQICADLATSG